MRSHSSSIALVLCVAAARVFAQNMQDDPMQTVPTSTPAPAATPSSASDSDDMSMMSGPKVNDIASRTLVRTDMQNRFQRLDVRPEEAALNLLAMDPDRKELARAKVLDRADALRAHLAKNIELVKEFADPSITSDNAKTQQLAKDLFASFDADKSRDPLVPALATVLTQQEQTQLQRLIDEYWEAWIASEQKASPKTPRETIIERLIARTFAAEVSKMYDSALRPAKQKLDSIITTVGATDEQKSALRLAFVDYIRTAQLRPTDDHKAQLARAIYTILTEAQRVKLVQSTLTST
jgi:hypothetical protein